MNASGWLQTRALRGRADALAKPLGAYMAAVYEGRPVRRSASAAGSSADLSRRGRRPGARDALDRLRAGDAVVQPAGRARRLRAAAAAAMAAAQPAGDGRRVAGFRVQHRRELRHQYQLAGLRRRDHDELSHADARPRRAELRVGGHRHGGARGADPRLRAQAGRRHRQLLGRPRALHRLHPAAARRWCWRLRW